MYYDNIILEEIGLRKRWLLKDRHEGICKYCNQTFTHGWYCPAKNVFWCFECDKKWSSADKPACGCLVTFNEHIACKVTCTGDTSDTSEDNDKKGSEEDDEENDEY